MEIQKIFSDQYDEERYYSVLMSEDELALYEAMFSDDEEEPKKSHRGAKIAGGIAAGTALTGGGIYGAKKLGERIVTKKTHSPNTTWEEAQKIVNGKHYAQKMQAPANFIENQYDKLVSRFKKSGMTTAEAEKAAEKAVSEPGFMKRAAKATADTLWNNRGKAGKAGVIAAGTATAAGLGYGGYKLATRKKD